ncbi:MAG: antitoxin Xre/MbcA/ParS toxin-binding domain-containing protein [Ginsengibacter sp.]
MAKKSKPSKKEYNLEEDISEHNYVSEAAVTYGSFGSGKFVILTGAAQKPEGQMSSFEKMAIVKNGITKKDLELLKSKAALDYTMLAKALSVTRATLINKKREQKFGMVLSEKIVSLADVYSYGFEVFGDKDLFNQWMQSPNRAIGGESPYSLIDNQYGREEIKNLIGRIAYGVYS